MKQSYIARGILHENSILLIYKQRVHKDQGIQLSSSILFFGLESLIALDLRMVGNASSFRGVQGGQPEGIMEVGCPKRV